MKRIAILLITVCLFLMFSACKGDPNIRKQKHYESGLRYLEAKQYSEASIEFQNAIQIDSQFAEAHYQLAKAYVGLTNWQLALQEFQKTVNLRPSDMQSQFDLGSMYLGTHNVTDAEQVALVMLEKEPNNADGHTLMANINAARNRLTDAQAEFDKALELAPQKASLQFNVGVFQARSGNDDEAEKRFKKALELDPKFTAANVALADLYYSQQKFAAVEQIYRDGIAANPKDISLYGALARFYSSQNRRADAEALLSQAKRMFGANISGSRLLGDFYVRVGDESKALEEFASLFKEHPKDTNIRATYVEILISENKLNEASRIIEDGLKSNNKDYDAILLKAQLLNRQAKYAEAIGLLEPSFKELESYHAAHLQMGIAQNGVGNLTRAESEWREAIRINPSLVEAYSYLAAIGQQRSDFELVRNSAERIIQLRPGSPIGYIYRAAAKGGQNDYAGADADLRQAIAIAPESPDGYIKLGMLRGLQKQYSEGERYFEIALQKDPNATEALAALVNTYSTTKLPASKSIGRINSQLSKVPQNASYWTLLGRTQSDAGDLKSARTSLEHALTINPTNDGALTLLAETNAALGDVDSAVSSCRKLIANNPRSATPLIMMASFEQRRGNFDAAQQFYQRALTVQPDHPIAANNLAFLMMEHGGNIDVALTLAQTARRAMPDNPSTADTLGWAYYLKGLYGSARDTLESAAKAAPDNAAIHYHLAMTYDKISEPAKAAEHYKKALQLAPNGPNAAAIRQALPIPRV